MKTCSKCGIEKELSDFSKRKNSKDGRRNQCKECRKYINSCLPKKIRTKEERTERNKKRNEFRKNNKEEVNRKQREYRKNNKEERNKKRNEFRKNNKEEVNRKQREYRKNNKEELNKKRNEFRKEQYNNNEIYKLTQCLRTRMRHAMEGKGFKTGTSQELLGCDYETVKKHLESQFDERMNWDNHGLYGWHIDHKKPCASFDLTKPERQKQCFNYKNLQPLWAEANLKKGDSIRFEDLFE
jgi:hypothetical protein